MFIPKACNYFLVNKANMNIKWVVLITNRGSSSYSSATGSNQDIHKRVICAAELKNTNTYNNIYKWQTVPRAKKSKNYLTDRCLIVSSSATQLITLKCPRR